MRLRAVARRLKSVGGATAPVFGGLMLAGLWLFAYNVVRTLPPFTDGDVTERHFAVAVSFVALSSVLGYALSVDLTNPFLAEVGLQRTLASGCARETSPIQIPSGTVTVRLAWGIGVCE